MLNENAKQWVKALRSGEYKQGKNKLRNLDGTFCCLGVACELAVKNGVIPKAVKGLRFYEYNRETTGLPREVQEWLGLAHSMGEFFRDSLYDLNDNKNKNFNEIADIIESEPEGLFKDN